MSDRFEPSSPKWDRRYTRLQAELPCCVAEPLWLRGRVLGLLICIGAPIGSLADIARRGAAALELATVRRLAIQQAVTDCWTEPLEDDATAVVMAIA